MAEAPLAVEDFSDDLLEEAADEVVGGNTKEQMLGTFSGVSSRLVTVHNGAVLMHAETEDSEIVIWSVVRVVSEKEVFEKGGNCNGWGLTLQQVKKGELFLAFGQGAESNCLVSFELPRRAAVAGQKRQRGAHTGMQSRCLAKAGGLVAFKDANGDLLRGSILAFVLYVPPVKGKPKVDTMSSQTVVFAFVFVAVRMSAAFVVQQRQSSPVPLLPASPVPLLPAQTLFESANVEVEDFPQAVLVDKAYTDYVKEQHKGELVQHYARQNNEYWNLTVCPGPALERHDEYGLSEEEADAAFLKVADMWIYIFVLIVPDLEGEVKPVDISISKSKLENLFKVHTTWWDHTAWNPALKLAKVEELVQKNNWLNYVCLPSKPASKEAKKITPNDPTRHAVGAVRFRDDLFTQNDQDFLKHFIPGQGDQATTARMQLRRLTGGDSRCKLTFAEHLGTRTGKAWVRAVDILLNGNVEMPAWFPGGKSMVRDLQAFIGMLEVDRAQPAFKELGCKLTKHEVDTASAAVSRMHIQRGQNEKRPSSTSTKSKSKDLPTPGTVQPLPRAGSNIPAMRAQGGRRQVVPAAPNAQANQSNQPNQSTHDWLLRSRRLRSLPAQARARRPTSTAISMGW